MTGNKIYIIAFGIILFVIYYLKTYYDQSISAKRDSINSLLVSQIELAGSLSMSKVGWKVCLSPDGITSGYMQERHFKGKNVNLIQSDRSEGGWYLGVQKHESDDYIDIYFIKQNVIEWRTPDDVNISEVLKCPPKQ